MTKPRTRYMTFRGAALTAEIRTAEFQDHSHLVVPVVALLGDVVVRPLNSTGPEFVPAESLAMAPGGWAGRPVVGNHPDEGRASANEPRTLEAEAFGVIFNPEFSDNRLRMEAWLDPTQAERIGGEAERVVEIVQAAADGEAAEPIEVSIGAWVSMDEVSGMSPSGEPFEWRWGPIVPDHLAVGLEGSQGACSVDMGCGAIRLNKQQPPAIHPPEGSTTTIKQVGGMCLTEIKPAVMRAAEGDKVQKPNFLQKIIDRFRVSQEDGTSDSELRNELWSELRNIEPGFEWIEAVFQDTGRVVYAVSRDDDFMLFRRSFELADSGDVTLGEEAEEVEARMEFVPVAAGASEEGDKPNTAAGAGCGCSENQPKAAQDNKEGDATMEKSKQLVDGLIEHGPFTDDDRDTLSSLTEAALEATAEKFMPVDEGTPADPPKPAENVEGDDDGDDEGDEGEAEPEAVTLSKEEYDDITAAASAHKTSQAKESKRLVKVLSKAQTEFTDAELKAKSVDELERLARLLQAATPDSPGAGPDFTGRGLGEGPDGSEPEVAVAPKPWTLALEKRKAATTN